MAISRVQTLAALSRYRGADHRHREHFDQPDRPGGDAADDAATAEWVASKDAFKQAIKAWHPTLKDGPFGVIHDGKLHLILDEDRVEDTRNGSVLVAVDLARIVDLDGATWPRRA